jgi:Tol biopolymer transport system component
MREKVLRVCLLLLAFLFISAPLCVAGITERISVDSDGNQGNSGSDLPSISADGRYVAFVSNASYLVPGDTNGTSDIFVHDRQTGITERVNVDSNGNEANNNGTRFNYSTLPSISADGRYVAFESWASNLVPGDTNQRNDVFVHDRETGITERVSVNKWGNQIGYGGSSPSISADGRYVAFGSNIPQRVYVRDRELEITECVSLDFEGRISRGGSPSISADGRVVVYLSNMYGSIHIYTHDRQAGVTARVSIDSDGNIANGESYYGKISGDGRYVAFQSYASNLVPGDTNWQNDVFVHDRDTGVTERVSVDSFGNQMGRGGVIPSISADGRYVAYSSHSIYVYDRQTGIRELASVDSFGNPAHTPFGMKNSSISGDGRYVAFESKASNLVPGDTNGRHDIFVRDRGPLCDQAPGFDITSSPPEYLWPPNRKIIDVVVSGKVNIPDGCTLLGAGYSIDDDYNLYSSEGELDIDADGYFTLILQVEPWRDGGDIDGRHYSISLFAEDEAGVGSEALEVLVPHDQRK